jgi:signal transduction histidine kinase
MERELRARADWGRIAAEVLERLPAGVLVLDERRTIVTANLRAVAVLGRPASALVSHPLAEVLPEVAEKLGQEGEPAPDDDRLRASFVRPDGRLVNVGFRGGDAVVDGRSATTLLIQDLTGYDALRRERDRLLQLATVGEVLPAILHELKNPLAAVTTAVEVLLEEVEEGHVQTELHAILTEVRRMKLSFDGIGLINHGLRGERHAAIDYALIEAFRILEPQMRTKGIDCRCDVPALPLLAFDPAVLRAVLFNLLTNSIYACPRGSSVQVEARLRPPGPLFELSVADTGTGMPPDVLARCRELFFTTKPNGSGIGLALCESVVTGAGGRMEIESAEGRGTTVRVSIPVSPTPQPAAPERTTAPRATAGTT